MMVRTGRMGYYVQKENEWPIARTEYRRLHLAAVPAEPGDSASPYLLLDAPVPGEATYSADAPANPADFGGASFVTPPLEEDMLIAGHPMLHVCASSTSDDMVVFAHLMALDEDDVPVSFGVECDTSPVMARGVLKLSHRKEDPARSTEYRPYHTHRAQDAQKLVPGEIVQANVEIPPTVAKLKKGWKLLLVVHAHSYEMHDPFDVYSTGARNTIHTGPDNDSWLQIPVVPDK